MVLLANPSTLGLICFCCPGMFNALNRTGSYALSSKGTDVGIKANISLSCVFAFSSLFAGASTFLVWNDPRQGASTGSYVGYMVVMTYGSLISVFLLPSEMVTRNDGTSIYTYKLTMNTINLTPRTHRAKWSRSNRVCYHLIPMAAISTATWISGISFIFYKDGKAVKNPEDYHMIDLVKDTGGHIRPFFLYFFCGAIDATPPAHLAGFYKFVQNLGGVVAPVDLDHRYAPFVGHNIMNASTRGLGEIIVCVVLVFAGVTSAIPVAFRAIKGRSVEEGDEVTNEKRGTTFVDTNN
ncbi:hypothetical protein BGZ83_009170 [Gryganskiella cystojenkinii]|nr:hypothetical protein BGZ83_009170 [Gryganskiella cystojenkinii]